MIASLEQIKEQLTARNEIAFAAEIRYHVSLVRVGHEQRVLMLTRNGKVVEEKFFQGGERLPELREYWRWQRKYGVEMDGAS